jgi:hypothetical protein
LLLFGNPTLRLTTARLTKGYLSFRSMSPHCSPINSPRRRSVLTAHSNNLNGVFQNAETGRYDVAQWWIGVRFLNSQGTVVDRLAESLTALSK